MNITTTKDHLGWRENLGACEDYSSFLTVTRTNSSQAVFLTSLRCFLILLLVAFLDFILMSICLHDYHVV